MKLTYLMRAALIELLSYEHDRIRYSRKWRVKSIANLHDLDMVRYARSIDGFGDCVILTKEGRAKAIELREAKEKEYAP